MAAKWNEPPRDALDTLILGSVDMASMKHVTQLEYMPFDPIVKRTEGTVKEQNSNESFKTTKGKEVLFLKNYLLINHILCLSIFRSSSYYFEISNRK